jgi:PAS domain S-box-containing protein
MSAQELPTDLPRLLLSAVADADAERSLRRVLELLALSGVRPCAEGSQSAWLDVTVGSHQLTLAAHDPDLASAQLRDLASEALTSVLLRSSEQSARERLQERFDMLSAASFEGIFIHENGAVIDANLRVSEMLRCQPSEVLGPDTMHWCVAPEDLSVMHQRLRDRVEGEYVVTSIRKDGTRFRAELLSKLGRLGERPVRVVAVRDVTERERTHSMLQESEERLRELLETAFDVFVISRDSVVLEVGGRLDALLGRTAEQIVGRPLFEFVAASALPFSEQVVAEQRTGRYELVLVDVHGELIPVEICAVISTLGGQPVRVAGIRDLRPLRRLQADREKLNQQLERSQRLESLGVLAGGIAHDFNNLLVGIIGNAEMILLTSAGEHERSSALAIRTAGERAAELTRQMLAYAGQREPARMDPVDLEQLLRELKQLLGATLSKKAELELAIAPGTRVLGERATLTQVMMNLLTNASDALEERPGKITVKTTRIQTPDARWDDALGATIGPGNWLQVEVSDSGAGMDEATRVRVFEPFFSTKPRGHGLGLAACLGIVSSHGGAIVVESEPGRGTRFSVLLPALDQGEVTHAPASVRAEPAVGRVLIIDDEQLVRAHLQRALSLRGYTVEEADGGRSGLARLARGGIDVIILDLTMGDMDGIEVIRRIRASGSRVPIVLSSGYLDAQSERDLEPHSFQAFLRKPYRIAELLSAIEQARAASAPSQPGQG